MIKILIVDDELLARIGIKSLISWNESGYSVAGEADNGKKAFEMIKELHPDIVITDMKMPVMNGIELIRKAKELPNPPDFIALSSYDDFDYVKQALVLGAKDYFLKLELKSEQLVSALERVSQERSRTKAVKRHSKQPYAENLSSKDYEIVKNNFLKEMIQGSYYKENEIEDKLRNLGISFSPDRIQCGVIVLSGIEVYQKYKKDDIPLFRFTVQNIISEIVSNYRHAHAMFTQSKEITVLYAPVRQEEMDEKMEELMSSMLKSLKTYLNITGFIGISEVRSGYGSIKMSYGEALDNAKKDHFPEGFSKPFVKQDNPILNVNNYIKQFDTILQVADKNKLEQCLGSIAGMIQATFAEDKHKVKSLCSALLLSLSSYIAEQPTLQLDQLWGSDPYQSLEHLYTDYDYLVWIKHLETTIHLVFNTLGESRKLIQQAKQFIHSHYAQNMTLEVIAEELNLSPNYLSYLFRKETKESVVEYLTGYRIEQAKKLLRTTHYKVYEVGQMVGYDSEQYFSRVFKKVVGIPPAKYKM
ncbi:response regulator [Paenibacillus sp. Marseille-P2973]|uniref:response regulator transcription factor n=1 Tax=Paenibacillus sp. Marseille-P2973 TaxID=1871032 RepID=UPI001B358CD0|nr:response regulator [Paenibacillus sp. Marseille-P2973]